MEKNYKFYFMFYLSANSMDKSGMPFCGHVQAPSLEDATKKAKEIAERVAKAHNEHVGSYFFDENGNAPCKLAMSVSIVNLSCSMVELVDEWGDCHDKQLRDIINLIWAMPQYDESFKQIMSIYWERDKEELSNYFDEYCYWWCANKKSFEEICKDNMYEEMCYQMFSHIFDDADYKAIINFIRPNNIKGWQDII